MSKIEKEMINFNNFAKATIFDLNTMKDVDEQDINKSGIYAIYIDSYFNDLENNDLQVFPIYIGQTKNLYRRKQQHLSEIKSILELNTKSYENKLKNHNEKTYLYFKIRLCLNNCHLSINNIKVKLIEYCDEKNLLSNEQYYIQKYCGIEYGFNQFESIHLVAKFKPTDEYYFEFLEKAKCDINDCLCGKYFFGFRSFNILMLCHNIICILKTMEQYQTNSKQLILLNNELFQLLDKMQEKYYDYGEYMNLDFIYNYLKEKGKNNEK